MCKKSLYPDEITLKNNEKRLYYTNNYQVYSQLTIIR